MAKKSQKTEKQEEIKDQELINETSEQEENARKEAAEEGEVLNGDESAAENDEEIADEKSKEAEIEEKMAELQDKYLRLTAEFDNYRKRTLKEKLDLQQGAKEDVLISVLSIFDDLERALQAVESAADIDAVKEGMKLIHSKFTAYLGQQGVKEIEALNKKLDTDLHEAVANFPVEEKKKKGKIIDVVEKGYTLKDKVIRFAKVVIGE